MGQFSTTLQDSSGPDRRFTRGNPFFLSRQSSDLPRPLVRASSADRNRAFRILEEDKANRTAAKIARTLEEDQANYHRTGHREPRSVHSTHSRVRDDRAHPSEERDGNYRRTGTPGPRGRQRNIPTNSPRHKFRDDPSFEEEGVIVGLKNIDSNYRRTGTPGHHGQQRNIPTNSPRHKFRDDPSFEEEGVIVGLKNIDGNRDRHSGPRRQLHGSPYPREERRDEREGQAHRNRKAEGQKEDLKPLSHVSTKSNTRSAGRHLQTQRSRAKKEAAKAPMIELNDMGAKQTCMVCTERRAVRHFPNRAPTSLCEHGVNTCKRCLRKWIGTQFDTKVWDQINCPECGLQMKHHDVGDFATEDVFRRYDDICTRAALEAIPGFRWCSANGCKSGQVHEGLSNPNFRCLACRFSQCVVHQVKWHKGETCAEYEYRTNAKLKKAEEEASKQLIKKEAKKCPNCKSNIMKNNGCDHMTCIKCRHEFCWVCLASYEPIRDQGNQFHISNCKHYAA